MSAGSRPNFLIFVTDQQRADHLGCLGHPVLKTPNIDKIADRGVTFTSCYTRSPACSPARATLFTGLTNRGHGMRMNGIPLREDVLTLPELLAEAGYRTHSVGKLHLKPYMDKRGVSKEYLDTPEKNPENIRCWQEGKIRKSPDNYYGIQTQDSVNGHVSYVFGDYTTWLNERHPGEYEKYGENGKYKGDRVRWWELDIAPELHYNQWIADRSVAFIKEQKNSRKPFFLWCSFPDPHEPYAGLKKWADLYQAAEIKLPKTGEQININTLPETIIRMEGGIEKLKKGFYRNGGENLKNLYIQTLAMISHVDEQIGRIMKTLGECGLEDNTAVVFLSDHGDMLGEHGLLTKDYWPYDGCTRVPFIISAPWLKKMGIKIESPVDFLDFMPTVLDFAGVKYPEPELNDEYLREVSQLSSPLPGESLKRLMENPGEKPGRPALVEFDDDLNPYFDLVQMRMIVTEEYKLCLYSPSEEVILFDRKNDPLEENNLFNKPGYANVGRLLLIDLINEINRTESRLPRRMRGA